jgi:hypothetical protein
MSTTTPSKKVSEPAISGQEDSKLKETAQATTPAVPESWDAKRLGELVDRQCFGQLVTNDVLYRYFDRDRIFEAVDWAFVEGFKKGHVPILYMYVRNMVKHDCGSVMSQAAFEHSLLAVVFLLMRTIQDVAACKRLFAVKDVERAYTILRAKMNVWLEKFRGRRWQSLRSLIVTSQKLKPESGIYPSPAWCTQFSANRFSSSTLYFGTPTPEIISSARETNDHVNEIRAEVGNAFLAWAKERKWTEFLTQDYRDLSL